MIIDIIILNMDYNLHIIIPYMVYGVYGIFIMQ